MHAESKLDAAAPPQRAAVPRDRLLNRSQVCELAGMSKTTLYEKVKRSQFPAPIWLGARMSRWSEAAVLQWVQDQLQAGRK